MKSALLLFSLCFSAALLSAQDLQGQNLPRLAVVEFDTNINIPKVNQDAVTVRNLVESQMVGTRQYQIITRTDIDRLLENQQIQVSSISSTENIRKLQLQNISYIVTGSVNAMDNDYLITIKMLDVSTGQFSHSADNFTGSASRDLYNGVTQLISTFVTGMANQGGQVTQVAQPSVVTYNIGDYGPAGGRVFYDKGVYSNGWRYLEAAPGETEFTAQWGAYGRDVRGTEMAVGAGKRNTQLIIDSLRQIGESGKAAQLCDSFSLNDYSDWFLPSNDDLNLMYRNLKQKGLGSFSNVWYWSSSQKGNYDSWVQHFGSGSQDDHDLYSKNATYSVRCVRAF
jgi:TolB-like protein